MSEAAARPLPSHGSARARWSAYARLAKLGVHQHWTPVLVAWSLLEPPLSTRAWVVLGLFLVTALSLSAAGAALDDVQGARDGLDRAAYGGQAGPRTIRRKPLLLGELDDRQALRFGRMAAIVGAIAGAGAVLAAPHRPAWLLLMFLVGGIAATQYAYGLKLSYLGGGEWLIGILTAGTVTIPVTLITGMTEATVGITGTLIGLLFVQVTICSNAADAAADRDAGRRTIAARLSSRAGELYVAAVFAAGWAITVVGLAGGALPAELALGLLPVWGLQILQLWNGIVRERWLQARWLGWWAFDAGVLAMIGANVAARAL